MHSIEREVKRNVGDGKDKFFKSINLISNYFGAWVTFEPWFTV